MTDITQLLEETRLMSSNLQIKKCDAFQSIVEEGDEAIPSLIDCLKDEPNMPVILALEEITDEKPYDTKDRGNVKKMAESWIDWYEED